MLTPRSTGPRSSHGRQDRDHIRRAQRQSAPGGLTAGSSRCGQFGQPAPPTPCLRRQGHPAFTPYAVRRHQASSRRPEREPIRCNLLLAVRARDGPARHLPRDDPIAVQALGCVIDCTGHESRRLQVETRGGEGALGPDESRRAVRPLSHGSAVLRGGCGESSGPHTVDSGVARNDGGSNK